MSDPKVTNKEETPKEMVYNGQTILEELEELLNDTEEYRP